MAEGDTPDLEILLKLASDTAGEDEVRKALQGVVAESKRVQQESRPPPGQEEPFKKQTRGANEFREVLFGLRREFPQLYHIAHLFLNPITAIIGGIAVGVRGLVEGFTKLAEVLKLPEFNSSKETLKAQQEELTKAGVAAQIYEQHIQQLANAQQNLAQITETQIDAIHRQSQAQIAVSNAKLAAEMARIDAMEKLGVDRGGLSPEQAANARVAAERKAATDKEALDKKARDDELEARRAQLMSEVANVEILKQRHQSLEEDSRSASAETAKARQAALEKDIVEQTKKMKELEAAFKHGGEVTSAILHPIDAAMHSTLAVNLQSQKDALGALQNQLESTKQLVQLRTIESASIEESKKRVESQLETLIQSTAEHERTLQILKQQNQEADHLANTLDRIKETQRGFETLGKVGGQVIDRTRAGEKSAEEMGIGVGKQQGRVIGSALGDALNSFGVGLTDQIVPMIQDAMDKAVADAAKNFDAKLNYLKTSK